MKVSFFSINAYIVQVPQGAQSLELASLEKEFTQSFDTPTNEVKMIQPNRLGKYSQFPIMFAAFSQKIKREEMLACIDCYTEGK